VLGRVAVASAITSGGHRLTGCILVTGRSGRLDPDEPSITRPVVAAARRLTGWTGISGSRVLPR
jgi:DNA-binding IclR family transcriptional regulator